MHVQYKSCTTDNLLFGFPSVKYLYYTPSLLSEKSTLHTPFFSVTLMIGLCTAQTRAIQALLQKAKIERRW
jgi:hypothetical protein